MRGAVIVFGMCLVTALMLAPLPAISQSGSIPAASDASVGPNSGATMTVAGEGGAGCKKKFDQCLASCRDSAAGNAAMQRCKIQCKTEAQACKANNSDG